MAVVIGSNDNYGVGGVHNYDDGEKIIIMTSASSDGLEWEWGGVA